MRATSPQPPYRSNIHEGILQPKGFPGLPEDWIADWETFPSSDGKLQLFGMHYHSKTGGPRAVLVVHGIGEHGGRYMHLPHYLKEAVDNVYCLDNRGHGRSEGLRGHVARFDLFAEDVALAVNRLDDQIRKKHGHSEIHLLGHSLGGLIALRAVYLHPHLPVRTLIQSAPLYKIKVEVPLAKKAAAKVLSMAWGSLHMTSEVDPNVLSHDRAVVEAYTADRLVHKKVTPRFYTEMLAGIADTWKRDSGFSNPFLMLLPLQDTITDPEAALAYFRGLKHRDKQLKTYPGFFHEPMNEIGKEKVFEDIVAWIKANSLQG